MKVLVTGAKGFVGCNLVQSLKTIRDGKRKDTNLFIEAVYEFDKENSESELEQFCSDCDFVFHLAGVNRPKDEYEFKSCNLGFAEKLLMVLKKYNNTCPVMFSSSIQAVPMGRYAKSAYGKSKKVAEELFFRYAKETGTKVLVYRFPNLFGKWCKPDYNSAVATFCNAVANDESFTISDRSIELELLYIDDLIDEMLDALKGLEHHCNYEGFSPVPLASGEFCYVPTTYKITLGEIVDLLEDFKKEAETLLFNPRPAASFEKKLYSTYLSYLPKDKAVYDLESSVDNRGSFTEFFRTNSYGQFSINISKPGMMKGQHWHNTKTEIFIVVSGYGVIQERRIGLDRDGKPFPIREYYVSGNKLQCVYILPGYTHNIINLSNTENMVTVMWANEIFDPEHPDTYYEEVKIEQTLKT